MRGVIGAAFIILGLAGGYLILTGKFPPASASSSSTSSSGSTTTGSATPGGVTGSGGISITPHTVLGIPTMLSMSGQAASLGGFTQ